MTLAECTLCALFVERMEVISGNITANNGCNYADWMSGLSEKLWDVPLNNLAIPGSHDAMTYCLDLASPVQVSEPLSLKVLDCVMPCISRPCLYKWGTTQSYDITLQLDAGIRYFDLRIAHKSRDDTDALYFAHGIYTLLTVEKTFEDIAIWLKFHPKEVVILSCSMFEGLDSSHHQELIIFMNKLFGDKLCPNEVTASLRNLWKLGYQVIISYDNPAAMGHNELWEKIPYWWANQVDPQKVISYLEKRKEGGRPEGFFVAGLNLTEDSKYILTHPCQSIKNLTLGNYALFLEWVKKQVPGPNKACLNIICGDFVGINRFIPNVIDLNMKLLLNQT